MTHIHAKYQGQRSLGSKVRLETDRRTDGGDCITCRANAVGKNMWACKLLECVTDNRDLSEWMEEAEELD